MPIHLKAYVIIMILATIAFAFLKAPVTATLVDRDDFVRRRNAWLAMTSAAFLSHSYIVYAFVVAMIAWLLLQRDRNPLAVYMALLFVTPLFKYPIPLFGLVNNVFVLDHQRLLCLVILLPLGFKMIQNREPLGLMARVVWWFALAYYFQIIILYLIEESLTVTMRIVIMDGLTMLLPLYVTFRAWTSIRALREAMVMYVVAMCLMSLIAVAEVGRHWLFYESLRAPLGVHIETSTAYFVREGAFGELLRAMVTSAHSIVLGVLMMIGICFWMALRDSLGTKWQSWGVLAMLVTGLLAALSRGPWVGTVVGVSLIVLAGPKLLKRLMLLAVVALVAILMLSFLPFGQKVLQYVPFMGEVGADSVDYRKKLFEVSMIVFWDSPIFGNFRAMMDPRLEQMRQGQGIIDMVNSYLGIGLHQGLVGIAIFLLPALYVLYHVYKVSREVETFNPTVGLTGRALFGAHSALLVTIGTLSMMDYVPVMHWMLVGINVNYVINARRVVAQHRAAQMQAVQQRPARSAPPNEPMRPIMVKSP